jgi:hypothetical protein
MRGGGTKSQLVLAGLHNAFTDGCVFQQQAFNGQRRRQCVCGLRELLVNLRGALFDAVHVGRIAHRVDRTDSDVRIRIVQVQRQDFGMVHSAQRQSQVHGMR